MCWIIIILLALDGCILIVCIPFSWFLIEMIWNPKNSKPSVELTIRIFAFDSCNPTLPFSHFEILDFI